MTFLEAHDGLSSDDMKHREECGFILITRYRWMLNEDDKTAVQRVFNDAWEALHQKEEAA